MLSPALLSFEVDGPPDFDILEGPAIGWTEGDEESESEPEPEPEEYEDAPRFMSMALSSESESESDRAALVFERVMT